MAVLGVVLGLIVTADVGAAAGSTGGIVGEIAPSEPASPSSLPILAGLRLLGQEDTGSELKTEDAPSPSGPTAAGDEGADAVPNEEFRLTALNIVMVLLAMAVLVFFFRRGWHRLGKTPWRPLVFEPGVSLGLMLGIIVLGAVGGMVAQRALGIEVRAADGSLIELTLEDRARLYIGAYALQAIVVLAFAVRILDSWHPAVDRRMPRLASGVVGLGSLIVFWPVLATVGLGGSIVMWLIRGEIPDPVAHDTLRAIVTGERGPWLIVTLALVAVVAPIVEEVAYRGLLQDALARLQLGPWLSITITSVFFALMHASNSEPHAVVTVFVLSLGFGWVYEKTGRLTAPIVMHILFNMANLGLAMLQF